MSVDEVYERPVSPRRCTDPTCPCQDGDACHYMTVDGTVAHPLPLGVYRLTEVQREALGWLDTVGKASAQLIKTEGYSPNTFDRLEEMGVVLKEQRYWKRRPTGYVYFSKGTR